MCSKCVYRVKPPNIQLFILVKCCLSYRPLFYSIGYILYFNGIHQELRVPHNFKDEMPITEEAPNASLAAQLHRVAQQFPTCQAAAPTPPSPHASRLVRASLPTFKSTSACLHVFPGVFFVTSHGQAAGDS